MAEKAKGKTDYLVLARKYRPHTFEDMIGQDALVRTLKNAVESNRLHHAYILQGIRGTGKTTTARLIAKVLNCENGPAISWKKDDPQCAAIENGNHVDVLEFDAASYTGVEDIKRLFEGVNYAPIQGKYKVYIIDEVHMLSKQAFNALLKTLEEPPAHVKFIFATTEVNKIPVTVISRCQRHDLKRISAEDLTKLYTGILKKEKVEYNGNAIMQIAKAADGSARDGLSLLDQAIALSAGNEITIEIVNGMLGMADRAIAYDLFEALMSGDLTSMLEKLSDMYETGHDPMLIVSDLLSVAHLITRLKTIPSLAKSGMLSELEKTRGLKLAEQLGLENLSRAYQMLLTVVNEAKNVVRPFEVVEMGLIRVAHMAPMPAISALINMATGAGNATVKKPSKTLTAQVEKKETPTKTKPVKTNNSLSWKEVVDKLKVEFAPLAGSLETQIRAEKVEDGKLSLMYLQGLRTKEELAKKLNEALLKTTASRWQIDFDSENENETLAETYEREGAERKRKALKSSEIQKILGAFPGSEVLKVNKHTINESD